jgi:hypothetical protein
VKWINTLTNDPNQTLTLKIPTGDQITFKLRYMESNKGWYFSFTYGSFSINNQRIVVGYNMLRKFRELLPFGFACTTSDNYEPIFKDDFSSGRAKFFLLDASDLNSVETLIRG